MNQVSYTVPNISCDHCIATIVRVVSELDGVESVTGDVPSKRVAIAFDRRWPSQRSRWRWCCWPERG